MTRGIKEFDRSNKCCLQEGGDLPRPRSPLWKNRHRSHSSRLPSRDGENNSFSPTKSCKFYHLVFLVFLSDILHMTRILIVHPTQVGKYTAYGSMIYTHTALHLASRNGHTRSDIFFIPNHEVLCLKIQNSNTSGWLRSCCESDWTSTYGQLEEPLCMRLRSVARCAIIAFFVCLFGNGKVFDNHFSFVSLLFVFFPCVFDCARWQGLR